MLGFIVLLLTLLVAGGATYLALKLPPYLEQWRFITGGIVIGLLIGTIFYWQQMHAANRALQERENAIAEASNRVASETTQHISDEVSKRYEQQIKTLTKQVADLESQLPNQGSKLNVAGGSSTSAANPTVAGVTANPNAAKQPGGTPNIFWIQNDQNGRGGAEVQFRIYAALDIPAFVAICDHPCRAVRGQAGAGSEGIPLVGSTDRDVAGFIFKKPRPMPAGTEGTVTIQSSGPVQVTAFRILRESEVPSDLR
jgi:hypothetical protein